MILNRFFHKRNFSDVTLHPFVYLKPSLGISCFLILLLLLPQVLLLILTKSYSSLYIILSTLLASVASECVFLLLKKQFKYSFLIAIIQGLITGFLLPATYSPLAVFFIAITVFFLTKYSFGGFASSWINPTVVTVITCYILNTAIFPDFLLTHDDLQSRNAALYLIQRGSVPLIPLDSQITAFLNKNIFSYLGIVIPEGYVSLFWDCGSAIPAFRFNFITLVSSIILFSFELLDILIPTVYILTYSILVRFVGPFFTGGAAFQGDIILCLLTSGTLFSTLYVLQWYGTTPVTRRGKSLYAFLAGLLSFFIMGYGTSTVGYMYVILTMNILSLLIQVSESHRARKKIENVLVPRLSELEAENV